MKLTEIKEKKETKSKKLMQQVSKILARYFNWLIIVLLIIIFIFSYFYLIKPKYQRLAEIVKNSNKERMLEYVERQEYLNKLSKLLEIYQGIDSDDIKKIDMMLTGEDVHEQLFTQLESLILKNGLLLKSLEIDPKDQGIEGNIAGRSGAGGVSDQEKKISLPAEIGKIKISLSIASTDYSNFKNILYVLEDNLRIMDIFKLNFNPDGNSIDLELYTYYLKS